MLESAYGGAFPCASRGTILGLPQSSGAPDPRLRGELDSAA